MKQHIHLLGICGTGMASLASLLKESGYQVTGSDHSVYPPMSIYLEKQGIEIFDGYKAENLSTKPDLIVVGNVISKDNPEAKEVLRLGLPMKSMPEALSDFFLEGRTPVIIAGTHGKTTLSTLTAWLMETAGEDPGFFIGGIGKNLGTGARIGTGSLFVIEGDEYDTAFFDKGPKFLHYRPQAVILTSVEFDHADIYKNLEQLLDSFRRLISIIPPDGLLIACSDDERVATLANKAKCKVITYGLEKGEYSVEKEETKEDGTRFTLKTPNGNIKFSSPLFGRHNLQNVIAAISLLIEHGISPEKIQEGLSSFKGVARRQDIVGESKDVTVIDDFAHHPTAVQKTIEAIKMRYPSRRLWAIFEPRSNTSRRNTFQDVFVDSFKSADFSIISAINNPGKVPEKERLDVEKLVKDIRRKGKNAYYLEDTDHIIEFLMGRITTGDVILIMSNGSFDNLAHRVIDEIKTRGIIGE